MKKQSFLVATLFLVLASLLAKFLGAVYRIPLTNILGAEGIGLYQLAFPFYSLLLVLTSTGVPNALAKIIAQKIATNKKYEIGQTLIISIIFFATISLLVALLVMVFAKQIALLQGNIKVAPLYIAIAPSIFIVSILSVFRGYFQGMENIVPTSTSLVVEQLVKLIAGLTFAILLLPKGIEYGAVGAVLGITTSEVVATTIIIVQYFVQRKISGKTEILVEQQVLNQAIYTKSFKKATRTKSYFATLKSILKITTPMTLSSMILPLVLFLDSFLIVNLLVKSGISVEISTDMYGVLTGVVNSLINLPAILALSVATCVVPVLSGLYAQKNTTLLEKKAKSAMQIVLYIALPAFAIFVFFPSQVIELLYGQGLHNGQVQEFNLAVDLLKLGSINVLFISIIQIITTILQSIDKSGEPLKNLIISCAIKVILTIILLKFSQLNIIGAMMSSIACFGVACFLNIGALGKYLNLDFDFAKQILLPLLFVGFMIVAIFVFLKIFATLPVWLNIGVSFCFGGLLYLFLLLKFRCLNWQELKKNNFQKK